MGANPYCYFTPYQADANRALQTLREQEFRAGRYDPALQAADPPTYTFRQHFPPTESFPSPGPQHASIEEAAADGFESGSGTGSILDIMRLSPAPAMLSASPTPHDLLMSLFATDKPSHADVERVLLTWGPASMSFWEPIGRGEARYFVVHDQGGPSEIFFAGYSID